MNRQSIAATVVTLLVGGCSAASPTSPNGGTGGPVTATAPAVTASPPRLIPSSAPSATTTPSPTPIAAFHLDQRGGTAFADGSVWMAGGSELLRIDPSSSKVLASVTIGGTGKFVFAGAHSIWVSRAGTPETGTTATSTVRVDPATNRATATVPFGVAFGFGSLWAVNGTGQLVRGDPATGKALTSLQIQGVVDWQPQVAVGFGSVWVASGDRRTVFRVDPATMQITATIGPLNQADSLLALGITSDSVWANANAAGADGKTRGSGMLYRINPVSNAVVASIAVGNQGSSRGYGATVVGVGEGSIWTGDSDGTVTRIDPSTNTAVAIRQLSSTHEFVAVGFGSVWLDDQRFKADDWTP